MKILIHFSRRFKATSKGFTLVELMVSMVVLVLLLLSVASLISSATSVTNGSSQRLESDQQARIFLDRVQSDLSLMPQRPDYDYQFIKANGVGGIGGNDRMFFYSTAPGYSGGLLGATFGNNVDKFMQQRNPVSLVGYMIDERVDTALGYFQARRFGDGNLWLPQAPATGVTCLAMPANPATGSYAPDDATTIMGNSVYKKVISSKGAPPSQGTGAAYAAMSNTDKLWPIVSTGVFRLEFTYLLKDGTYSVRPLLTKDQYGNDLTTKNHWGVSVGSAGDTDPNSKSDYRRGVGARWWNETSHRSFICTSADISAQTSVWQPYGLGDVAGIVVSIATIDTRARTVLNGSNRTARWNALLQILPDASADPTTGRVRSGSLNINNLTAGLDATGSLSSTGTAQLPAQVWSQTLGNAAAFNSATLPATIISQVRVYQRVIYLR